MLKNEALFLPEGLLAVIITTIIVSLCTSIVVAKVRSQQISEHARQRMVENEISTFSNWNGCEVCITEEKDSSCRTSC